MSLLARIRKRSHFPVETDDGLIYVRPWKFSEHERLQKLDRPLQQWFMMGVCLVDEEGKPEFTKTEGESDQQFAERVKQQLDDIDFDLIAIKQVDAAIAKIISVDADDLKKSFPKTGKLSSQDASATDSSTANGGT